MSWAADTPDGAVIGVKAQPKSSRPGVEGPFGDDALKVRIKSAPVDGKANRELVEVLAKFFGVPKSSVEFKGGETSKTKRLLLRGLSAAEAVRRLEASR